MRRLFPLQDRGVNLPTLPGIFPDQPAPIVRSGPEGRELTLARWGMPTPRDRLGQNRADRGVTNIRRPTAPHWRGWLGSSHRCLVPFTAFAEYESLPSGGRGTVWFAFDESRPLGFFAGLWLGGWTSVRKIKEGPVTADLFAILTCAPNAEVGAIHPQAMPVILTDPADWGRWLAAPWPEVAGLQRPLPDGSLRIVARGQPEDPAPLP